MIQDMVVVFFESLRYAHDLRFDLQKGQLLNARVNGGRPECHPASQPDHKDFLRVFIQEHWQMTKGELALQSLQMEEASILPFVMKDCSPPFILMELTMDSMPSP